MGLVLNRPLETSVRDVWKQVSDGDCLIEGSIHQGGPCEGPLMVLHSDEAGGDMDVMPGITMSTNREAIEKLVTAGASPTRSLSAMPAGPRGSWRPNWSRRHG